MHDYLCALIISLPLHTYFNYKYTSIDSMHIEPLCLCAIRVTSLTCAFAKEHFFIRDVWHMSHLNARINISICAQDSCLLSNVCNYRSFFSPMYFLFFVATKVNYCGMWNSIECLPNTHLKMSNVSSWNLQYVFFWGFYFLVLAWVTVMTGRWS